MQDWYLPGALDGSSITPARSSSGSGPRPFKPVARVQIPHGTLVHFEQHNRNLAVKTRMRFRAGARTNRRRMAKWCNRQTRGAQNAVPSRAWEFDSPLGHLSRPRRESSRVHGRPIHRRWASAQRGFISLTRRVRPPDRPSPQRLQQTAAAQITEAGRVRKLEKRPGREPGDFVGSTPTSVTRPPTRGQQGHVVQREDASMACWRSGFESRRVH